MVSPHTAQAALMSSDIKGCVQRHEQLPITRTDAKRVLTKQNEPELVKMQELGESCLKRICKAVRRIREEVGPHGDRCCDLQK